MKKTVLLTLLGFLLSYVSDAGTFYVTTTTDGTNATSGTLRWAINQANLTAAKDTIKFNVAGTWTVNTAYDVITYPLCIDGFSAPGAVQGILGTGVRQLTVVLNGVGTSTVYGLQISASNCEIKGLVIQDFYKGIYITGSTATSNWIWGNYIGTSADGLSISSTTSCWDDGIAINNNSANNIIGTNGDASNDAYEGNLIAGNGDGAQFYGEGITLNEGGSAATSCTGNRISGNYLGVNETGTGALYVTGLSTQRGSGVQINYSSSNIIGTNGDGVSDDLERNLISGNTDCGIVLIGSTSNKIKGNYIGTTKTGLVGLANYSNGGTNITAVQISIKTGSNSNIIGTDGDGVADAIEGNVIGSTTFTKGSNNSYNYGMWIHSSTGNRVSGNKFGIGSDGLTPVEIVCTSGFYSDKGIYLSAASTSNIIGTNGDGVSDANESNYFGNTTNGVTIDNSNSCVVAGNYFGLGTNLTTAQPLAINGTNYSSGVYILNSTSCRIGSSGSNSLERNYFCNSAYDGVWVDGASTANNDLNNIRYNTFGIRPDGVPAPNGVHAIEIYKQSNADTVQYNIITQNGTYTPDGTYSAVLVGGINSGEEASGTVIFQNQIYKNIGRGIDILNVNSVRSSLGLRNKISQNSIYNNGNANNSTASTPAFSKYSLGIDLDYDGTTANDSKDTDDGPNEMINFPIITGVSPSGTGCTNVTISGSYNGLTSTSFIVELFSSDVCNGDTAGTDYYSNVTYRYGEGRTYLGTTSSFTTGNTGNQTWSTSIPVSSLSGKYLTAVAIQTSGTNIGNTSEFSECYPLALDAGDAPDTYKTLLSNCGPAHFGVGANTLLIGTTVTADSDGQPAVMANLDTDEGVSTLPSINVKSTSVVQTVTVKNTTGSSATLHAWIDFDRDGVFESTEYTSAIVATGASPTTPSLTWTITPSCGVNIVEGISYMRLRLTSSTLTDVGGTTVDERSYGSAANGEVEDYKIYINGVDYGDLPATYPIATAVSLEDTATAKVWAGITKPSTECTQKYSVDAYGEGSEEDGLTTSIGAVGSSYTWVIKLNANQANKMVYYGLWLDWDANKTFTTTSPDAFYSGSITCNGPTTTSLAVSIPSGYSTSAGFRLVASSSAVTSAMYNSTFTNGEVEDWLLLKILNAPGNILMGSKQSNGNLLRWKNTATLKVVNYIVERSIDNINWTSIGNVLPLSADNSSTQYSYSDIRPLSKENNYRVKLIFADDTYQYTNTVSLVDKNGLKSIMVYPNPAKNTLNIHTTDAGLSKLKIMDVTGRLEKTQDINTVNTSVDISNLAPGTHLIKFISQTGEEEVQRFVKMK